MSKTEENIFHDLVSTAVGKLKQRLWTVVIRTQKLFWLEDAYGKSACRVAFEVNTIAYIG